MYKGRFVMYFYNVISENIESIKKIENPIKTIKAIVVPRNHLEDFYALKESTTQAGIYILYDVFREKPIIYIGQSSIDISSRLKKHNLNKKFWKYAIVFMEKENFLNLNGTYSKVIESMLLDRVKVNKNLIVDNDANSNVPVIKETEKFVCIEWVEEIITISKLLGLPFFDKNDIGVFKDDSKDIKVVENKKYYKINGINYDFVSYKNLYVDVIEEIIKLYPNFKEDVLKDDFFKGVKRNQFSESFFITDYKLSQKELSNGLWVDVNHSKKMLLRNTDYLCKKYLKCKLEMYNI